MSSATLGGMVMTNFAHVSDFCPNEAYPDYGKLQNSWLMCL